MSIVIILGWCELKHDNGNDNEDDDDDDDEDEDEENGHEFGFCGKPGFYILINCVKL